jgi:putative aminopeptidase FrvX
MPPLADCLDLLSLLVREPSVVGAEDCFFRVLRRELEEVGVYVQHYQGVMVARGRDPDGLMLSVHVDRHGLFCTGPNEFQYAAYIAGNRGELTGDSVSEQMMETVQGRFAGERVQAHLPWSGVYLGQGCITHSYVCPMRNNLIFEVEGLEYLPPGTPVSFLDRLKVDATHISAQLDNVLSVAIVLAMFRHGFQGTALFTAQEEAGRSWRYAYAWFQRERKQTDRLLVLDTSPFATPEAAGAQHVVLRTKDSTASFAEGITGELAEACDEFGISYVFKDAYVEELNKTREKPASIGRTELGRLVAASDGAVNGTTLQVPTTGYHTANETAALVSVEAVLRLLGALSQTSGG